MKMQTLPVEIEDLRLRALGVVSVVEVSNLAELTLTTCSRPDQGQAALQRDVRSQWTMAGIYNTGSFSKRNKSKNNRITFNIFPEYAL